MTPRSRLFRAIRSTGVRIFADAGAYAVRGRYYLATSHVTLNPYRARDEGRPGVDRDAIARALVAAGVPNRSRRTPGRTVGDAWWGGPTIVGDGFVIAFDDYGAAVLDLEVPPRVNPKRRPAR